MDKKSEFSKETHTASCVLEKDFDSIYTERVKEAVAKCGYVNQWFPMGAMPCFGGATGKSRKNGGHSKLLSGP
jgi:hypothetical protein